MGGKTAHHTSLAKIGQNRLKPKFLNQDNKRISGMPNSKWKYSLVILLKNEN